MKKRSVFGIFVSVLLIALCITPFVYVLFRSIVTADGTVIFSYYYEVFLANQEYLFRFWRSLFLTLCITAGQTTVSILAGYGFAKSNFPGKNILFFLLMALMIMPLQVTLVPNYTILDKMGLLDTYYALALPAIFVPLGTFIMTQSFKAIPNEIIEASRVDGCNTMGALLQIGIPATRTGIICTLLLSFLDGWNLVEQPMVYLRKFMDFPISVALASIPSGDPTLQLVCCLLVVIPPLFLFVFFNRELAEGVAMGKEK